MKPYRLLLPALAPAVSAGLRLPAPRASGRAFERTPAPRAFTGLAAGLPFRCVLDWAEGLPLRPADDARFGEA